MATRRPAGVATIKEKNRRNTEKTARREGGTFTNKAGKTVGISKSHAANRNAGVLASSGSPEAKAFNANQPARGAIIAQGSQEPFTNPTSPTNQGISNLAQRAPITPPDATTQGVANLGQAAPVEPKETFTDGAVFDEAGNRLDERPATVQDVAALSGLGVLRTSGVKAVKGVSVIYNELISTNFAKAKEPATKVGKVVVNSKTVKTVETSWKKHFGPKLVQRTNINTGKVTGYYETTTGGLVTPKVMMAAAVGTIIASASSSVLTLWWNYEASSNYGIAARDFARDAKFETDPVKRAELLRLSQEFGLAQQELLSVDGLEWVKLFTPVVGPLDANKNTIESSQRVNQARLDVLTDASATYDTLHTNGSITPETSSAEIDSMFWEENNRRAHERKMLEIETANRNRLETEEIISSMNLANSKELIAEKAKAHEEELQRLKEYWTWYELYKLSLRDGNVPSKLSFGLI